MTKAEEREVIIETLQQELIERFDTNIEYYSQNIDDIDDVLEELGEMNLYNYLQDLIENKLDFLIEKYGLVVVDGELNLDLVEPIYIEYIEKFVNGELEIVRVITN